MIPNSDERTERQLYAAYRLILSWPKVDAQREESRLTTLLVEDIDRTMNTSTTRRVGNGTAGGNANG